MTTDERDLLERAANVLDAFGQLDPTDFPYPLWKGGSDSFMYQLGLTQSRADMMARQLRYALANDNQEDAA